MLAGSAETTFRFRFGSSYKTPLPRRRISAHRYVEMHRKCAKVVVLIRLVRPINFRLVGTAEIQFRALAPRPASSRVAPY